MIVIKTNNRNTKNTGFFPFPLLLINAYGFGCLSKGSVVPKMLMCFLVLGVLGWCRALPEVGGTLFGLGNLGLAPLLFLSRILLLPLSFFRGAGV